jgi:hypothetical protein
MSSRARADCWAFEIITGARINCGVVSQAEYWTDADCFRKGRTPVSARVAGGAYQSVNCGRVAQAVLRAAQSHRSKFNDEAISAVGLERWHELKTGSPRREVSEPVLNLLHKPFLSVLLNLGQHVLQAVTLPAKWAEHAVIELGMGRHCQLAMTRCALDLLASATHESTPGLVDLGAANLP